MEGSELSVVTAPDRGVAEEINGLLDRVTRSTGRPVVSEPKRTALDHAIEGTQPDADHSDHAGPPTFVAGVVSRTAGQILGYAPVLGDPRSRQYAFEVAVDPAVTDPHDMSGALVDAVADLVTGLGGGTLRLWQPDVSDSDDPWLTAQGFEIERDLIQMRCPLPVPAGLRRPDREIRTRPFRPGRDEEAWLATNNRAFATHPEQGHWDLGTLVDREKEPWFDPEGFLLLEEDGQVAGFCWTKIHADTDPPMGEIYVIGVDPRFHGRGWGRALTEAGLDWLADQGLDVGMLYVDADNVAAVSMYRSMGFVDHHVDRAYIRHLD